MKVFKILQRKGAVNEAGNKCPKCSEGWRDFMQVDQERGILGCYKCGTTFLSLEMESSRIASCYNRFKEG